MPGRYSEWVVSNRMSDAVSMLRSTRRGLTDIPSQGWSYYDGGWWDDLTLLVTGHCSVSISSISSISSIETF